MTDETPTLLDKLRLIEQIASQVENGSGRLFQLDHAATLREAIAALERPLAGVVEGHGPSDSELSYFVARAMLANLQLLPMEGGEHGAIMQSIAPDMNIIIRGHVSLTELARAAIAAIDLAPRVADAYARGVEDAANEVGELLTTRFGMGLDDADFATGYRRALEDALETIRSLLPKAPATEDAREKEATEHDDDLQAANCILYHQMRELD